MKRSVDCLEGLGIGRSELTVVAGVLTTLSGETLSEVVQHELATTLDFLEAVEQTLVEGMHLAVAILSSADLVLCLPLLDRPHDHAGKLGLVSVAEIEDALRDLSVSSCSSRLLVVVGQGLRHRVVDHIAHYPIPYHH